MAFPTKMYFSLSEVSARWHRQTKDVEYCIENGLLNAHIKVCSVKLTSNMLLNKFPHNSQEIYEYTGCKRITPEDCHILFRHYKRQVSEFISSDDTKREKLVFPEKITIKKVDLMILLCDLKQFEEKYQLKYEEQDLPLWNNNVSSSEIAVNNDCDFFYIGNTLYSFGHMNFYFNTRAADVINPRWAELSSVFMEAGLNQVFVGIESGSKEQLKRFKKPTSVENNKKCLDILEQNGFNIEVGYILFDPYSTVKELKESLDFFDKTRLYNKRVYLIDNLKITPFSKFHDMAYTKQLALSPLNVQTVSYDYEFEDAKVQKIWNTASKWKRNVEKKYSTYEANTRGESNNIFFAEEAKILNYLEFQVISNLVKYADSGIKDYKELCQKSMKIYENIINHKSKGKRKQTKRYIRLIFVWY